MDLFLRCHTVSFARKEGAAANALTPTWNDHEFLSGELHDYITDLDPRKRWEDETIALIEKQTGDQTRSAQEYFSATI